MRKIWERDKSKEKHTAYKELLYTFYVCDFKSPYASYPIEEKVDKVTSDIMPEGWNPDPDLVKLIEEYRTHQELSSPSLRLLKSSRQTVHKLADWLENVSYEGEDAIDPAKVAKTLGEIGRIIDSLNKLEDKVKKEVTTSSRARGGGQKGLYEG